MQTAPASSALRVGVDIGGTFSMLLHALLEARTVVAMARVVVTHLLVARPDAGARLLAALEPTGGPDDVLAARRRRKTRRVIQERSTRVCHFPGALPPLSRHDDRAR